MNLQPSSPESTTGKEMRGQWQNQTQMPLKESAGSCVVDHINLDSPLQLISEVLPQGLS